MSKAKARKANKAEGPPAVAAPLPLWPVGLLVALVYLPSLSNGLTNWDDPDYVTHNPIAKLGWAGIPAAFTQIYDHCYYPLTHATYAVVNALGGSAGLLHGVQVLLIAITAALIPLALGAFGVPRLAGVCAALLWAIHPLRVDSVSWGANLKDTLGAAFVVGSFALHAGGRRHLAAVAFAGAMLSKSAFFGLALLFPLLELRAGAKAGAALVKSAAFLVIGVATAIGSGLLHMTTGAGSTATSSLAERIATGAWTPWWYVGRILVPFTPREVYDFSLVSLGDWRFLVALGAWAGLIALCFRVRALIIPVLAFLFALAPVSGLVPLRFLVADRYTLFPALALVAGAMAFVFARWGTRVVVGITVGLLIVMTPLNVLRQREWHDSIALWESNARVHPESSTVQMNLAEAYADAGRFADARKATEALYRVRKDTPVLVQLVWLSGIAEQIPPEELNERRDALGASDFSEAVVLEQGDWLLSHGFLATAESLLQNSPSVQSSGLAQRMLSAVARRRQDPVTAIERARKAISLGEQRAQVELVFALVDAGKTSDALREADQPMSDEYGAALLRGAKGYALMKSGRVEEGKLENAAALETIRRLSP